MATKKLERARWQQYFDGIAKRIPSMRVAVSVLGDELGVQEEADGAALIGISYDHHDGVLTVDTAHVSHRIENPSEIYVREENGTLSSFEAVLSDGTKRIVELQPLPSLPAS
jgi:hypothetical protein